MMKRNPLHALLFCGLLISSSPVLSVGPATGGHQINTGGGIQATPTNSGGSSNSGSSSNGGGKVGKPRPVPSDSTPNVTPSAQYVLPGHLAHLRDRLSGYKVSGIDVVGTLTPDKLRLGAKFHIGRVSSLLSFVTLTPQKDQARPIDTTCIKIPPGYASNRIDIRPRPQFQGDGRDSFYLLEVLLTNRCTTGGNKIHLQRRENNGPPSTDDVANLRQIGDKHYLLSQAIQIEPGAAGKRYTFQLANRPEQSRLASFGYLHSRLYRIYLDGETTPDNTLPVDRESLGQNKPGNDTGLAQGEQTRPDGNAAKPSQGGKPRPGDDRSSNDTGLQQGGKSHPDLSGSTNNTGVQQGNRTTLDREHMIIRGGPSFAKITGIAGRSKDPNHRGWHEVLRWSLKPRTGELLIVKKTDRASTMFQRWAKNQSHVSSIVLQPQGNGRNYEVTAFRLTSYKIQSAGIEQITFEKITRGR